MTHARITKLSTYMFVYVYCKAHCVSVFVYLYNVTHLYCHNLHVYDSNFLPLHTKRTICFFTARKRSIGQGNGFTHVCHSVHGGVSVPACTTGHMTGRYLSRGVSVQGRGSLSEESLSMGVSVWGVSIYGGLCPGGSLSGGSLPERDPPTVTSGRYASYWNAFVFLFFLSFGSLLLKFSKRLHFRNRTRKLLNVRQPSGIVVRVINMQK